MTPGERVQHIDDLTSQLQNWTKTEMAKGGPFSRWFDNNAEVDEFTLYERAVEAGEEEGYHEFLLCHSLDMMHMTAAPLESDLLEMKARRMAAKIAYQSTITTEVQVGMRVQQDWEWYKDQNKQMHYMVRRFYTGTVKEIRHTAQGEKYLIFFDDGVSNMSWHLREEFQCDGYNTVPPMGMTHVLPVSASRPQDLCGRLVAKRNWCAHATPNGVQQRTGIWEYGVVMAPRMTECWTSNAGTDKEKAHAGWQVKMDSTLNKDVPPTYLRWPLPPEERGMWVFRNMAQQCRPSNLVTHSALCSGMLPQMEAVQLRCMKELDFDHSYTPPSDVCQTMDYDHEVWIVAAKGHGYNGRTLGWHAGSKMQEYTVESLQPAQFCTATTHCQPYSSLRRRDYGKGLDARTLEGEDSRGAQTLILPALAGGLYECMLSECTEGWRNGVAHKQMEEAAAGPNGRYWSSTANINLLDIGSRVGPKKQTINVMVKKEFHPFTFKYFPPRTSHRRPARECGPPGCRFAYYYAQTYATKCIPSLEEIFREGRFLHRQNIHWKDIVKVRVA